MAFSATAYNTQYIGPGKTTVTGLWSGSAGDAAGSMQFGGVVTKADFQGFDSTNSTQILPRVSVSTASGISTITINNQDNVTVGYFTIEKLG